MLRQIQPMGIIYTCNPSACFQQEILALSENIPLVVIKNRDLDMEVDVVELNNAKPGRLMARHLLELGHRKVGFISPPLTRRQQQRFQRVEGFMEEFREAGIPEGVIVKAADEEGRSRPGICPDCGKLYKECHPARTPGTSPLWSGRTAFPALLHRSATPP